MIIQRQEDVTTAALSGCANDGSAPASDHGLAHSPPARLRSKRGPPDGGGIPGRHCHPE